MMNNTNNKPRWYFLNLFKSVWRGFKDFSSGSSLHGLKYFNEKITILEKLFWATTFIASIVMCAHLISKVKYKWQTSPVIVTFNEKVIPVWQVPFPAITICPQIKCKQTVYNYTDVLAKLEKDAENETSWPDQRFFDISLVCKENHFNDLDITNASMIKNLNLVAPNISECIAQCTWRDDMDCEDNFKEVLTKEGICFTFNTLSLEEMYNENRIQTDFKYLNTEEQSVEWTPDTGYTGRNMQEAYPRIGQQNGANPDLKIYFVENLKDRDAMCNSIYHGYKVYMHHPADMPQSSLYYYSILPKKLTALAAKMSMVSTSHSLESYSPEIRQCYFPKDRKLKYFKVYTQNNCELECLSNYTYKMCNCVWFHMPHDNSSQICTSLMSRCVKKAKENLSYKEIDVGKDITDNCHCLPPCDNVAYDAEVLKTDFDFKTYLYKKDKLYWNDTFIHNYLESKELSCLEVYFKEPRFVSMRRSELFGTTEFLANCGGLLGLFLGFSFLSIVEIVYYLTLRIFCRLWRKKQNVNNLKAIKTI